MPPAWIRARPERLPWSLPDLDPQINDTIPGMDHTDHVNLLRPADLALGGTWADLGAGSGAFTLALRELVGPEAETYAVDRDAARLAALSRAWTDRFGDS